MSRPYCPTPDRCHAPKRGICTCQARKKALADPEVRARMSVASKKAWASKIILVPDHLKSYAAKLRRCGIRGDDLRQALEAAQ